MGTSPAAGPHFTERSFSAGTALFAEGDASADLYVLLRGTVEVSKRGRRLATIEEPGSYFGEMSSLLGVNRTATVRAVEDSTLLVVAPEDIPALFGTTPQLALRIARNLAARLAQTSEELVGQWELPRGRE